MFDTTHDTEVPMIIGGVASVLEMGQVSSWARAPRDIETAAGMARNISAWPRPCMTSSQFVALAGSRDVLKLGSYSVMSALRCWRNLWLNIIIMSPIRRIGARLHDPRLAR